MPAADTTSRPSPEQLDALLNAHRSVERVHAYLKEGNPGLTRATVRDWVTEHRATHAAAPAPLNVPDQASAPSREEMLEDEVRELRAALKKQRREAVADERIIRSFENAADRVEWRSLPKAAGRKSAGDAHHRQVLLLSDFHGGEYVDTSVVNGLNAYDWEIMEARVEELITAVESHQRKSPKLTGLDVGFLGDMCSGANHDEIKETNQYVMAEQGIKMGYLQAEILAKLASLVPDIRVFTVEGNHPRFDKAPAAKNPHNNVDWMAATFTREIASRDIPNLSRFEVGRGSLIWEVAGRKAYVFHGDGIRSTMPGVPWGGVMRRVNNIQAAYPYRIDHFWLGHFHQCNVVQAGRIGMNGSLKGTDEWVQKNFGAGEPPVQLLLTFDERAERLTDDKYLTPTAGL